MTRYYHKNPRQITGKQLSDLERWLAELGDLSGIVHNLTTDEIIGGNQRARVFGLLDHPEAIVITEQLDEPDEQGTIARGYVDWNGHQYVYRAVVWDERKAEQANIVANKAGGSWDFDVLANEFETEDLLDWGFEPFELGIDDLDEDEPPEDAGPQIDKAEELREQWGVEPGQLWQLGKHRVICGDCTDAAVVERVMGGEKADAVVTDPPYGWGYYDTDKSIPVDFWLTMINEFPVTFCVFGYFWLLSHIWGAIKEKVERRLEYIAWCPTNYTGTSQGHLVKAHQDILVYAGNKGIWRADDVRRKGYSIKGDPRKYRSNSGRFPDWEPHPEGPRFTDSWNDSQPGVMFNAYQRKHPNEKPLSVTERLVDLASSSDGIVLDCFLGSGTTLIACENLGRQCRGIEIEPKYVAVTLQRWADTTGQMPVLLDDINSRESTNG